MRTIFPHKNKNHLVSRTLSEQVSASVKYPITITHYALTAKVYKGADGYHAVWTAGGKRVKKQFKRLKEARQAAKEALKLIHKGKGDLANLSSKELAGLLATRNLLLESGYSNFTKVAQEYLAAKTASDGADLMEAAKFWATNCKGIKRVSFEKAAQDWFKAHQHRWADTNRGFQERRIRRLIASFQIDACDLNFDSLQLFFEEELKGKSGKYRNHYRETLRGIIRHCVDLGWLPEKHGLNTLLKNEKAITAAPQIITPTVFRRLLEAADAEVLPVVALMGFCGVRRSETARLTWEDIWATAGYVVLNASQTKTAQRRLVPRFDALEAWLSSYSRCSGPVWKHSIDSLNHVLKPLRKLVGISGIHNALRHSYASYRLAVLRNANELAIEMGNSPQIIYKNYRELVTPAQGKQWFSVLPRISKNSKIIEVS